MINVSLKKEEKPISSMKTIQKHWKILRWLHHLILTIQISTTTKEKLRLSLDKLNLPSKISLRLLSWDQEELASSMVSARHTWKAGDSIKLWYTPTFLLRRSPIMRNFSSREVEFTLSWMLIRRELKIWATLFLQIRPIQLFSIEEDLPSIKTEII